MTNTPAILRDLTRAKLAFQARAIRTALGFSRPAASSPFREAADPTGDGAIPRRGEA